MSSGPATPTSGSWPDEAFLAGDENLRISIVEESPEKRRWAYRSEHFEFVSDAPLRSHVIRDFAAQFELTYQYCSLIPFNLDRINRGQDKLMPIHLLEDYQHYVARGGRPGSAGVYLSRPDVILVPFRGLGLVKRHNQYSLDPDRTTQALSHEVTHMLMRGPLLQAGWFAEGSAEYVSTIPITQNRMLPSNHLSAIQSFITGYGYKGRGGYNLGPRFELPPLRELMECDYEGFQRMKNSYPYSLLVFYFFAHMDGEGDAAGLRAYADALQRGAEDSTARKKLLAGRDYRTLEKLLTGSWAQNGIYLTFRN